MNILNIPKPGKSKQELLEKLERFKNDYSSQINENDITIEKTDDGYKINAQKKVLFMSFYVNAEITAKVGAYEISWESNAPKSKVDEALEKIKIELEKD
jgi:hypothetical protein